MTEADDELSPETLKRMNAMIQDFVPHNRSLGLEVVRVRQREVWVRLPYRAELVGNPETGVLHGGAVSSMMDAASGLAVMSRLGRGGSIATLDLRIDYLKPASMIIKMHWLLSRMPKRMAITDPMILWRTLAMQQIGRAHV